MARVSVIRNPSPRPKYRVASVTMKAMIARRVMNSAFNAPNTTPMPEHHRQRHAERPAAQDQLAPHRRRHKHDRADRQVHARRQQHKGHADGHDAGGGGLDQDVDEVVRLEEGRRQARRRPPAPRRRAAPRPGSAARKTSWSGRRNGSCASHSDGARRAGCVRGRIPAARLVSRISPRLITRMRSHMPISSSSSDEMISTPRPAPPGR